MISESYEERSNPLDLLTTAMVLQNIVLSGFDLVLESVVIVLLLLSEAVGNGSGTDFPLLVSRILK